MVITDETWMFCENCGETLHYEDANTIYHPPVFDSVNGGSPEEYEVKCPKCGEELWPVENFCEVCEEPIVKKHNGYYDSSGHICEECGKLINKHLTKAIESVKEEFDFGWNDAAEVIFLYADDENWMKKEETK